jgi:hypothetical protein
VQAANALQSVLQIPLQTAHANEEVTVLRNKVGAAEALVLPTPPAAGT